MPRKPAKPADWKAITNTHRRAKNTLLTLLPDELDVLAELAGDGSRSAAAGAAFGALADLKPGERERRIAAANEARKKRPPKP